MAILATFGIAIVTVGVVACLHGGRVAHIIAKMKRLTSKLVADWRINRIVANERYFANLDDAAGEFNLKGIDLVSIVAVCVILGGIASLATGSVVVGIFSTLIHAPICYGLSKLLFGG